MKTLNRLTCLLAVAAAAAVSAQTPQVTSSKSSYRVGEAIAITFANGPGNSKDWIGVYPTGVEPGSVNSTIWNYVDGTQAGDTGLANGVVNFPAGLGSAGTWVAYLLENDGYTKLASVEFATVPGPAVATDKRFYGTNETITVTFSNGPGNAADWIGIYPEGATPGGPGSTRWAYVNGTQTAGAGLANGSVVFTNGMAAAGRWVVYFLENDGYTQLASATFQAGQIPSILVQHSLYFPGTSITVGFTNGPANPKDWVGIYPDGAVPGGPPSTLWQYTDGAGGTAGRANGTLTFSAGLTNVGPYTAYLLENDGYNILASNRFAVIEADAPLLRLEKRFFETREPITASFANAPGNTKDWIGIYPAGVTPGSVGSTIWRYLDDTQSGDVVFTSGAVLFPAGLNVPGEWVAYLLENDGYTILARETFTVVEGAAPPANSITLGAPVYFENFDSTPEGELPPGWTARSFTEILDENFDLQDLNSASYANWVVVSASRFASSMLSYVGHTPTDDYRRVLSTNRQNAINGTVILNLATGNLLFGNSGYRSGRSQVIEVFTPDFDLSGRTDVHLAFHSLYEQNQDSFGAVEYSIDGGTNWLPVIYLIDAADLINNDQGQIDVMATLTTEYTDVAYYDDPETGEPKGGTYGSFVAAPLSQALAPYISGRINDDPIESKRVEYFRLSQADNQRRVRFRFAYAGTDSWYFGIDNFGLYASGGGGGGDPLNAAISRSGTSITVSWTGGNGPFQVQKTSSLSPANWQNVTTPAGATSVTDTLSGAAAFYRVQGQ